MAHKYMFGDMKPGRTSGQTIWELLGIHPSLFDAKANEQRIPVVTSIQIASQPQAAAS